MSLTAIETVKILLETAWRYLLVTLFSLVRVVYVKVQRMYWRFNGTLQQLEESVLPENYERCVQVLDVLFHHAFDWSYTTVVGDEFLLAHNRFESPSYIIDNDHVTLLTLTQTHAVFTEGRDRNIQVWRTQYGAFLKLAQIPNCCRLLFVPLGAFHRLSETVGDPDATLVFLHSTGRCGSTLVVQMMNETDEIVAISEPEAINTLFYPQQQNVVGLPIDQLRKDVVRLVCRPFKTIRPRAYLVKLPSFHARHIGLYQELFPNCRQLFMYRNSVPSIRSQYRMVMGMLIARTRVALTPLLPDRLKRCLWVSVGVLDERFFCEDTFKDVRLFGLGMLIEAIVYYLQFRQKGFAIEAIRYEDIVTDPKYVAKRILKLCGASDNLLERTLQGMKADSQRSSSFAKTAVENYLCPEFDPEFRKSANRLFRNHELPELDEELLLEGTISQRNSS